MLIEKLWINSCWKIAGGLASWATPGRDHLCSTGGLTACLSLFTGFILSVAGDFSPDRFAAKPPGSFGAKRLAIAPNGLELGTRFPSFSERVCSNTACIVTSQTINLLCDPRGCQNYQNSSVYFLITSISRTALGISSISPTRYKVALAG